MCGWPSLGKRVYGASYCTKCQEKYIEHHVCYDDFVISENVKGSMARNKHNLQADTERQ